MKKSSARHGTKTFTQKYYLPFCSRLFGLRGDTRKRFHQVQIRAQTEEVGTVSDCRRLILDNLFSTVSKCLTVIFVESTKKSFIFAREKPKNVVEVDKHHNEDSKLSFQSLRFGHMSTSNQYLRDCSRKAGIICRFTGKSVKWSIEIRNPIRIIRC